MRTFTLCYHQAHAMKRVDNVSGAICWFYQDRMRPAATEDLIATAAWLKEIIEQEEWCTGAWHQAGMRLYAPGDVVWGGGNRERNLSGCVQGDGKIS